MSILEPGALGFGALRMALRHQMSTIFVPGEQPSVEQEQGRCASTWQ